ncbi:acyltransferase family protein [Streptomyces sp. 900105755]
MAPGPLGLDPVDGVSWTLWVEARFYLLMAALLVLGLTYRRVVACCGAWLLAGVIARELHSPLLDEFVLTRYTGLFVAGIVLHLMHRFGQSLLLGFAWCYQLTVLGLRVTDHAAVPPGEGGPSWAVCAVVLTVCLGLLALAGTGPLTGLRWRWPVTAGALTYPFYLVHQSLGVPLAKGLVRAFPGLGPLPATALSVVCMLGLSLLVHGLVERRLGRRLRRRLTLDMRPRDLSARPALTRTR